MEVRLNKMISDSGICSRREADKFIEEGRVTVNGQMPHAGQKITDADIVLLDDLQIKPGKQASLQSHAFKGKAQELIFGPAAQTEKKAKPKVAASEKKTVATEKKSSGDGTSKSAGSKGVREGKYVKYNKYAAARHAAREKAEEPKSNEKKSLFDPKAIREATEPKHGKSLGRSAVAQRLASSSKSAALRKTSKNNPVNKAKRAAGRNRSKEE